MTLSEVAVRRPVFITMVTLAIMVMGVTGYSRLSTDLYPDVTFPFVSVVTVYPGASPSDVESQINKKIEDAIVSVNGLEAVQSMAFDGYGQVIAQFRLHMDIDRVASEVREKVSVATATLPSGAKEPIVSRVDLGALPIMTFAAGGALPIAEARRIADDRLKSALEQLEGVAEVRIKGGLEREVQVLLEQPKLQALRLSPLTVLDQLKQANMNIPGGRITRADNELSVRTVSQFENVEQIERLVVATDPRGGQVQLSDVASVVDGFKDVRTMVRINGEAGVALEVIKQNGANTVAIAHAVRKRLAELEPTFPEGFKVTPLLDQSVFIEANAHEVTLALWFGGLMAVLVILVFMMDVRSTLISAVALPTSVVGTFYFMYLMGFSLNMMTLLGLSLAIGLLIDDAVVVRENIFKYLERGDNPHDAAIKGTREVQLAVLATTLTICAVFVPVAFMSGIVGQFFKQFGLTVSVAVLLSLWVAFTLDPMLSSRFSKVVTHGGERARWVIVLDGFFAAIDELYRRTLAWALVHRKKTFAAAVVVFIASVQLTKLMGQDFVSAEDRGQVVVRLEFPTGTSLEETARRTADYEQRILQLEHVRSLYAVIGPQEESNRASWRVIYSPKEERSASLEDLKSAVRAALADMPDAQINVLGPPTVEGLGDWQPIVMHVTGPNLDALSDLSRRLVRRVAAIPGVAEVDSSLRRAKPDIQIALDRDALAHRGLSSAVAGMAVRIAINGEEAGYLRKNVSGASKNNEVPIRVRLREEDRKDAAMIGEIALPGFDVVKLADVAQITESEAPAVIERFNRERRFMLSVTPVGRGLAEVADDIMHAIDELGLPEGYAVKLDGDAKNQKEGAESLGIALLLAVIFIYIVLAAQFESFVHPFTIMLSLPLALVGAWLGLFLAGKTLSISSNIGVILLMGLVTKNAILLVDSALQEQRHGSDPTRAIKTAGQKRLRPILMTSAAMVLGMLPTAFGSGAGSEFRGPMAIAVIGGVVTSTLLTLVVIPIVYVWLERLTAYAQRRVRRAPQKEPATTEV